MNIPAKPWNKSNPPKRVLAIRLQAMGDLVISLPYLQYLRKILPASTRLDLLTRKETDPIPRNIVLFNKVYSIGGERDFKKQLVSAGLLLPRLLMQRYDVVLDLQNNMISNMVRKVLMPTAWVEFDRFSPVAAGERYRQSIEAAGIGSNKADNRFRLTDPQLGHDILKNNGWNGSDELVVLNPAGAFETRNWEMHKYVEFARLWLKEFPQSRFVILGTSFIASKAVVLQEQLRDKLINLAGKTTAAEAFAILQRVKFVLSEDSGLMHMAWVSGVPSIALFGGTRSDWSRPLGDHTFFLDSSDLPCGSCMQALCKFGDIHCLTRITPLQVFGHALGLIQKLALTPRKIP